MEKFELVDFIYKSIIYITHKNLNDEDIFFNNNSNFETDLKFNINHLVELSKKLDNFFDICIYRYELENIKLIKDLVWLVYEKLEKN